MLNTERLHLDSVGVRVRDLDTEIDFYQRVWGLRCLERNSGWACMATRTCSTSRLFLIEGAETSLSHLSLCTRSKDHFASVKSVLEKCGAEKVDPAPSSMFGGHPDAIAFCDPDRNVVEIAPPAMNVPDNYDGLGSQESSVEVQKLGHIVLGTPDLQTMEEFYQLLGFVVTDRTANGLSFLRANRDHHTLALLDSPTSWLQHLAFDVGGVDEVMTNTARLVSEGYQPLWGPGRHGPGNNVFAYFHDPEGIIVEYYGDLEEITDELAPQEVRYWGKEHKGDVWGIAGPPPTEFLTPRPRV